MSIEWKKVGDEYTEPSGRFVIATLKPRRLFELVEANTGPVIRGKLGECLDKATAMDILSQALESGFADTITVRATVDDLRGDVAEITDIAVDGNAQTDPDPNIPPTIQVGEDAPDPDKTEPEGFEEINDPLIAEEIAAATEVKTEDSLRAAMEEVRQKANEIANDAPQSLDLPSSGPTVQDKIDALVAQYGDFRLLPKRSEVVQRAGLTPADVTDAAVEHGMRKMSEDARVNARKVNADPSQSVKIVIEGDPEFDPRIRVDSSNKKSKTSEGNSDNTTERKGDEMKTIYVNEAEARELLQELEFHASDTVDISKVTARLNGLDDQDDETLAKAKDHVELRNLVLKALKEGKNVSVGQPETNGDAETESNGVVKPAKARQKKKAEPKVRKKAAEGGRGGGKKHNVKVGTIIEREYKGKTYKVEALEEGFKVGKEKFSSLTEAAKSITGAKAISGPAFFQLV